MVIANFIDGYDEITSSKLTQWDYGQKLFVYGLTNIPEVVEVHFWDKSCDKAIVTIANKFDDHLEVIIPDDLLKNEYPITAFIYLKLFEYNIFKNVNNTWVNVRQILDESNSHWLSGSSVPLSDIGVNGDFYVIESSKALYKKSNGTWSSIGTLGVGVDNPSGAVGSYYAQRYNVGETVKTVFIPVIPRKEPNPEEFHQEIQQTTEWETLLNAVADLNTKFARVYGLNDEQLSIKICDAEPTEKDANYLYIYPDTKYEELSAKVDHSLEELKSGAIKVGRSQEAINAEDSHNAYVSFNSGNSIYSEKSKLTQMMRYIAYDFSPKQSISYCTSDNPYQITFSTSAFKNLNIDVYSKIEVVFEFQDYSDSEEYQYQYERVIMSGADTSSFRLNYLNETTNVNVLNKFKVKYQTSEGVFYFTITYFFNDNSNKLYLNRVYIYPILLSGEIKPVEKLANPTASGIVQGMKPDWIYYVDVVNPNSRETTCTIKLYSQGVLKDTITDTVEANSSKRIAVHYVNEDDTGAWYLKEAIVRLSAEGYIDSDSVIVKNFD